jgi:hypothetical protein
LNKELEILTLDSYLMETKPPRGFPEGITFTKTFPATEQLPNITVGLGLLRSSIRGGPSFLVDLVPEIKKSKPVMLNTFINEVAEQYLKLFDKYPDRWQEALLLELGHVRKPQIEGYNPDNNIVLFDSIPPEEKVRLLQSHHLHEIATVVSYGYTEGIDVILGTIEKMNEDFQDEANYASVLECLRVGVPLDELEVAVQLPPEMIAEIYSDYSP